MSELEDDYKKDLGKGSGSETGYYVEARHNGTSPMQLGEQIFDKEWRRVNFNQDIIGVPQCNRFNEHVKKHGFYSYQAAEALRWWFHAESEAGKHFAICMESRIIRVKIEHSYSIEAISAHKRIGGDDRTNCIPDWGK